MLPAVPADLTIDSEAANFRPMPLLRKSPVTHWFENRFADPTPAQVAAWPRIEAGNNVLIVSPTGTGKTFAAFLSVLNELALLHETGGLRNTIHCIYISPLRALSYDLEKNLNGPLKEIFGDAPPIRVGLRSGDTTQNERAKQFSKPPHILLTTPESLALLLSQERWLPHLSSVRWMIIDEIHALAENKRGAHLSISLERLDALRGSAALSSDRPGQVLEVTSDSPLSRVGKAAASCQRIGLSATVAPLSEVAQFLVGTHRSCEIVDVSASKKVDLRVYSPLGKNPYPAAATLASVSSMNSADWCKRIERHWCSPTLVPARKARHSGSRRPCPNSPTRSSVITPLSIAMCGSKWKIA